MQSKLRKKPEPTRPVPAAPGEPITAEVRRGADQPAPTKRLRKRRPPFVL
jgi:hypothetical protein